MKELKTMSQNQKRAWKLLEFPAHHSNVNSISLGQKLGNVIVTGGGDKKVNLWAVGKPNCILSLSGHSTPVDCVQFSLKEDHVCAGSAAGALKIWDLESTKILRTLTGHRASIRCVDFHPYGDFLASGSCDNAIKMWDVKKKGCIFSYKGHNSTVNSLKFSPDGQWISSGGDDGIIKIWDIRVGKVLAELRDHTGPITDVKFHPHEFLLASGSQDRTVKFWDLENFALIASSLSDVPSVRCIAFDPYGNSLLAASADTLRVHSWEPSEVYDQVAVAWSKIQDLAFSEDHLIGVTSQMTNISVFIVNLRKVNPFSKTLRASSASNHNTLRKNFNKERSNEFAESLNAMKAASEESDSNSLPTDPEIEEEEPIIINKLPADFHQVFYPGRDLSRTPPPQDSTEDEISSNFMPPPQALPKKKRTTVEDKFNKNVTVRPSRKSLNINNTVQQQQMKFQSKISPEISPRRSSVPSLGLQHSQSTQHLNSISLSSNSSSGARSRSPDYLSSRQSSLSDDSTGGGPISSRSDTAAHNMRNQHSIEIQSTYHPHQRLLRHSPSESHLSNLYSKGEPQNSQNQNRVPHVFTSAAGTTHLHQQHQTRNQCQVKPMLKTAEVYPTLQQDFTKETDYCNNIQQLGHQQHHNHNHNSNSPMGDFEDFVPISLDKPTGITVNDFLPKKSAVVFQGGVHCVDINEADMFNSLKGEHQSIITVLSNRQRNLRIINNVYATKDVKTAVETAGNLRDSAIEVDLLNILVLRPSIWNLDLCVSVLPTILELLQSRFEAYMTAGCSALRLILKNFASVIKQNIDSPIQTVGVDISREERYTKSLDCYRNLVAIRNFTLKRQTVQGKLGHDFRELHILLSSLD